MLQDGVDAERISKIVEKSLSSEGPLAVQVRFYGTVVILSESNFGVTDFLCPWSAVCH